MARKTPTARLWRDARARFGIVVLTLLGVLALLAPVMAPRGPAAVSLAQAGAPPSAAHPLGTDELGRDVWSRLIWGGRVSLTVGVVAVTISTALGVLLGLVAGFYGGALDALIMRLCDLLLALPFLPLALTLAAALRPGLTTTMILLGFWGWAGTARIVRAEVLALREQEFVLAARAIGAGDGRLLWRHLLPGVIPAALVAASLGVAWAVLAEAGLSSLGLGVPEPLPSWGNLLAAGLSARVLLTMPWVWLPPGLCVGLAAVAINLLGDGLRDALDPRTR